jgi:hypothetical protein
MTDSRYTGGYTPRFYGLPGDNLTPPNGGSSVKPGPAFRHAGSPREEHVVPTDGEGLRYDNHKPMYELIPPEMLDALAAYFTQAGGPPGGPTKYPLRNWERGMLWTRCFGALMRHAWKWLRGEDIDAETGAHHMIAVVWNATVLYAYSVRGHGTDDRPRYVKDGTS